MAHLEDRWHKVKALPSDPLCAEHGKAPTARHGRGQRWRVRWEDGGIEHGVSFAKRADAEWHMSHLAGTWCIVPRCGKSAITEPPVLLCLEHKNMVIQQTRRRKPTEHEPVVYFIRNGSRVKIGWTTNLRQRLTSLTLPASAVALLMLGGDAEEKVLHRRFAAARVGRTEWFESCPSLEDFIVRRQPPPDSYAGKVFAQVCGELKLVPPAA